MCMSDCRARCAPDVNWVMLSWVGASCTAATCWLKWADITCSHRISTVLELLAASRFRLEPHWNRKSEWTFPADYYEKNAIFMFLLAPVAEWHFLQFLWVSVVSTGPWHHLCCCLTAPPSSTLLCAHGWYQLPRFLGRPQHYTKAMRLYKVFKW